MPHRLCTRLGDVCGWRYGAGGWTERSAYESFPQTTVQSTVSWLTTLLYASDAIDINQVVVHTMATAVQVAIIVERGVAHTIRQMLAQEATVYQHVAAPFECDNDAFAYTEAVIGQYLDADDYPTQVAVLLGADLARRNGFAAREFGPDAGLAWATRRGYVDMC